MSKSAKLSTDPYKGVRDFYPEDEAFLNYLFAAWRRVCERFGYVEYSASILESSELYKAKGAENEELVNEQTYTFVDRGEREVTLRPEMTPTVARMVAARKRELGYPLRWYSIPNCFRYERPQHGRLREFWQLNIDIFGSQSLAADAEVIALCHATMLELGAAQSDFVVRVSSRKYLNELGLGAEAFALLDKRDKMPAQEFEAKLRALNIDPGALLPKEPPEDVAEVLEMLKTLGVENAVYDGSIIRGFNYYTGVVFEIFDSHPDNNRSLFGGGRYDNLLSLFSDETLPAVGAAAGDATMKHFLEVRGLLPNYLPPTQVYIGLAQEELLPEAMRLAQELRQAGVRVAQDFGEKKLGDQIRNAAKHKIPYLVVVGQDEVMAGAFGVRNLESGEERHLSRAELPAFFLAQTM